ncbi:unnamed protein product [Scytosiphon promiscuus]
MCGAVVILTFDSLAAIWPPQGSVRLTPTSNPFSAHRDKQRLSPRKTIGQMEREVCRQEAAEKSRAIFFPSSPEEVRFSIRRTGLFFHVGFSRTGFLAFLVQESDSIGNGLRNRGLTFSLLAFRGQSFFVPPGWLSCMCGLVSLGDGCG